MRAAFNNSNNIPEIYKNTGNAKVMVFTDAFKESDFFQTILGICADSADRYITNLKIIEETKLKIIEENPTITGVSLPPVIDISFDLSKPIIIDIPDDLSKAITEELDKEVIADLKKYAETVNWYSLTKTPTVIDPDWKD